MRAPSSPSMYSMQRATPSFRAFAVPAAKRWRATGFAVLLGAVVFFVFEATKELFVQGRLSPWESHTITIVFGALIAGAAAWMTLRRQESVLQTLAAEAALREGLESRQRALEESEARYRQLVEQSPEAIAVHSRGEVLYVNAAGVELIGALGSSALEGRQTIDFIHPEDRHRVQQRQSATTSRTQYRLLRLDGALREVDAASVAITYEGSPAVQTVFRDITERKALEARLLHEAFHDALTGLANRSLFRDRLEHALALALRAADSHTAICFLDLDDFKGVNDSLGHEAGDALLRAVGERLREATRTTDTVARFGGDEFAVLIERLATASEALGIVKRINRALRRPLTIDGRILTVSASIGVAFAEVGDDVDTLLRKADVAMYEAKEAGKARHAVFEPAMYDAIVERLYLESALRTAATDPSAAGMYLVYQPIVDLHTGEVHGLEALTRWRHAERGDLSPMTFIPVAEQTGAIVALGYWILETACRQLSAWRVQWWRERRMPETLPLLSVNISGRQLSERDFVERVRDILHRTGIPASCLTLEITESVIMRRTEESLATLSQLKALGLRLAIDDFGTGYSSLSYLQRFPVDVLKIDRAFVEGVADGGSDAVLARTIVTLGKSLGLRTVAEGVERPSQHQAVRDMGCDLGQGYLFSPPLGGDVFVAWMLARPQPLPRREAM